MIDQKILGVFVDKITDEAARTMKMAETFQAAQNDSGFMVYMTTSVVLSSLASAILQTQKELK